MNIGGFNIRPFVVTLQEMPEKQAFIQEHFKKVGIQAENWNGIHGVTSGFRTVWPYENDAPGSGWNIGQKPAACWISFWALWSAMTVMPEPYFLQLEYDSKFPDDWKVRTEAALKNTPPDFDMLYLGSCCTKDLNRTNIKGEVYDVRWPLCGHGIVIAKKALPIILSNCRKCYAPIDIHLQLHVLPLLKCYTVLPRIVDQWHTDIPA